MENQPTPVKKESKMRLLLKYGVPLVISVGLCYLLFTGFDFHQMIEIVRRDCNFWWIAGALVISIFSHIFRAMRWRIQLAALNVRPPLFFLVLSIFGTYAVNLILPRLGELWRTGYIAQRQKAPFTTVFGSMVADRLADTITVLLLTLITFLFAAPQLMSYLSQNEETYQKMIATVSSPMLWGAVIVVAALVWWVFRRYSDNPVIARVTGFVKGLWEGFIVITQMKGVGQWLMLTVAIWGCYFFQLYLAFFAFPLTAEVVSQYGVLAVMVCFVLSSISMGVPSNGGIGPWQWAIIFGLSLYASSIPGLDKAYSASFANLVLGSQTLLLVLLGLFTFVCVAIDKKNTVTANNSSPLTTPHQS